LISKLIKNILFVSLFIFIVLGCNSEPTAPNFPYESKVNVFALLILNNQQKIVRIEHTYKATEYYPEFRGITDAEVSIGTAEHDVKFIHQFNGVYYDIHKELMLQGGETYYLNVTLSDGKRISAQCTMPSKPKIVKPIAQSSVDAFRFLDIEWEAAQYAHRYLIYARNNSGDFATETRSNSTAVTFYPFLFAPPDYYVLKVVAADRNYYDYIRSQSNRDPILHINGALGVFGAVAYDEIVVSAK